MNQLEIILKVRDEFSKSFGDLNKVMDDAKKQLGGFSVEATSAAARVGQMNVGLIAAGAAFTAAGAAAGGLAGYLVSSSKASLTFTGHLADLAEKAGRSTTFMQEIDAAGKLVGVSLSTTTGVLAKFNASLGNGDSKPFLEGLAKIHLSVAQLKAMSPEDQFNKIAASIRGLGSISEQSDVITKVFGRGGLALLPLITSDFEKAAEGARKLGNVMSVEMVAAGDLLGDRITTLSQTWESFNLQVGGLINQNASLHAFVTGVTEVLGTLKTEIFGNTKAFQGFVSDGVILVSKATIALADSFQLSLDAANSLQLVYISVESSLLKIARAEMEVEKAFSFGNWGKWAQLDGQVAVVNDMLDKNVEKAGKIVDRNQEWSNSVATVRAELAKVQEAVEKARGKTVDVGDAMKKAGGAGGDALVEGFSKAEKAAEKLADRASKAMREAVGSVYDSMLLQSSKFQNDARGSILTDPFRAIDAARGGAPYDQGNSGYVPGRSGLFSDQAAEAAKKAEEAQAHAAETAARWAGALQGVALMAGSIGGKLGDTLSVMANIGKSFEGWDDKDKNAKFNAIAGGVGQIGGLVGGKTGGAIQGAAGGAMAGYAVGGVWGAAIGGVAGGIMGLFGASKAQKKELADTKKQLEGLSETAQKFGIDLTKAFSSKSVNEVKQAISDVGKAVEDQKKRLAGLDMAGGGLNAFTKGGGLSDAASVDRGGLYAGAIFGGMVKETGDVVGALKAIGPALAEMSAKAAEFGVSLSPGVANLLGMNDVISKNEGLADQVSGLNSMMKGLGDAGMVTKDLFAAFGADTSAVFARLVEGGATGNQALTLMQPTLQQLYEGQKLHGFAVDETTQGLIDQAKAEGIVGDAFMSANERIVELLGIIAQTLGATLPDAYNKAASAAEDFGRRATNSAPKYPNGGGFNPGGGGPEDSGLGFAGGTGFRNFGSGTRVTLHGDEAVLTRPQADRLVGMAVAGVPGSYQASSTGVGAPINVTFGDITISANDARGGLEAADAMLRRLAEGLESGGAGAARFRSAHQGLRF